MTIICDKCGKKVKRVPEVLDSWIEAGSASFAERHFPFNKEEKLEDFFPPDFVAEYTGQIRAWFYVLHVIGAALYKSPAFKNVGVEGVILGSDGRKMSKNLGNYPDPKEMLTKYGGDALRLYLMGSPVMHGEDIIISEEQYRNQVKGMMLILWNTYNFFVNYANVDMWQKSKNSKGAGSNVLDEWILSLLNTVVKEVTDDLNRYDTVAAISKLQGFIDDFSTWYIRRSRDRVGPSAENQEDKNAFYETTYTVLTTLSKLLAPITPFLAEEIYRSLTNEESVHLSDWPESEKSVVNASLISEMEQARKVVEIAHSQRKEAQLKVRQPLASLATVTPIELSEKVRKVVADEVNVLGVTNKKGDEVSVKLDTVLTSELEARGKVRDIIRKIQEERKQLGTALDEKVNVSLLEWPSELEDEIKRKALINTLQKGEFKVSKL